MFISRNLVAFDRGHKCSPENSHLTNSFSLMIVVIRESTSFPQMGHNRSQLNLMCDVPLSSVFSRYILISYSRLCCSVLAVSPIKGRHDVYKRFVFYCNAEWVMAAAVLSWGEYNEATVASAHTSTVMEIYSSCAIQRTVEHSCVTSIDVSLCLKTNAETVPKIPSCHHTLLM